ncbi:hypothetical protein [Microvirga roseola]|uniref:hypothetical protein n=1 Tax=Microvirga roseola TaxID=2883126 RepID=UPI001E36A342|nr:hypothetical protein [Microvirga roseola]
MSHPRNPRRAYDADGSETPPVTVGQGLADGYRTLMVYCEAHNCGHGAEVPLKDRPPHLPVPDVTSKLRCSQCGGRRIRMMVNVTELYARAHGAGSTGG